MMISKQLLIVAFILAVVGNCIIEGITERQKQKQLVREQCNSALMRAAENLSLEGVRQALANGANINARNHNGDTALHRAVLFAEPNDLEDLVVVVELIENGSDLEAQNQSGKTVVHYAAEQCNCVLLSLLDEKGAPMTKMDNDNEIPLDWARYTQKATERFMPEYIKRYEKCAEEHGKNSDWCSEYKNKMDGYLQLNSRCKKTIAFLEAQNQ